MSIYHIFSIKKNIKTIYKNNEVEIFNMLEKLSTLNKYELKYGVTIYKQICIPINKNKINNYFANIKNINKNKYLINNDIIIVNPSHIIYKANKMNPNLIYMLNNYSSTLFICDFKNKTYNWLNNIEI